MTGTFKEFYKFVQCFNPSICGIWEDYYNRPDPKPGDRFMINFYNSNQNMLDKCQYGEVIFDKVDFDPMFKNGVAFIYYFHDEKTGDEYSLHSINDVDDYSKLTIDDLENIYGFWRYCSPVTNNVTA